jgi:4-alpha-glucanotransferase
MTDGGPFPRRTSGVLLHPSSLPGREPIGTVGADAQQFVDWLATAGASIWQILPLTMYGRGDSPYFSGSAFAGNVWLIDLAALRDADLLTASDLDGVLASHDLDARIDFDHLYRSKWPLLSAAARRFLADGEHDWHADFDAWSARSDWLDDVATFLAIKSHHDDSPWWEWPEPLRCHEPDAVARARSELADAIDGWRAVLYFFDRQWAAVRERAHAHGIRLFGDLPIYVGHDAADVWAHQDQFHLYDDGRLIVQAGCPPDYFSATGQRWGNPIYRWDAMAADGYAWWISRLRRCVELTDIVRIDHFRALSQYWEIPGADLTAVNGRWVDGPGQPFIDAITGAFDSSPLVAEDLGVLDDAVYELRDRNHLPGMRILQFGFDGTPDNPHRPDRFPESCIVYTGTHDNAPVGGWWESLDDGARADVAGYYQFEADADRARAASSLIEAAYGSRAIAAITPIQDWLALDMSARMNDPSQEVGQWGWRMPAGALTPELAARMRSLAERNTRCQEG